MWGDGRIRPHLQPRETKLVRDARAAGLRATTGLGMLVEQAALAFTRWTSVEVDFWRLGIGD
ncbi:MAG: hypothetical protein H6662_01410 [Ardenticatenaceae bacterium]|nr:hypothetical protein [Ardenticatenaceae bacterium]